MLPKEIFKQKFNKKNAIFIKHQTITNIKGIRTIGRPCKYSILPADTIAAFAIQI